LEKREIKVSSTKRFKGSAPPNFYSREYFLEGEGSNYGREPFAPYDESYLIRNRELVKRILSVAPRLNTVLVLGAARGYLVRAFRERGVNADGVDLSRWAVENCAEGVEPYMYWGDVCDLSKWVDGGVDLVVALDVLEHIRAPDDEIPYDESLYKALDEAVRVGCMVLLDVPIMPHDDEPDQSHGTDKSHVSCYSKHWWIRQFMERGMEPFGQPNEYAYPEEKEDSPWPDKHDHGYTVWFRRPIPTPTAENITLTPVAKGSQDFKILWWANAFFCGTGYGVGTAGVVFDLLEHYNVRNLAFYGLEGKAMGFSTPIGGTPVKGRRPLITYPKRFDQFGSDAAKLICDRWKPDIMVTLFDIWIDESLSPIGPPGWLSSMHPYWVPIIPVDHDPIPMPTLVPARRAYKPVAMSRFGQRQLEANGVSSTYIPHGVETSVFKPSEDKVVSRQHLQDISVPLVAGKAEPWPEDCFVIGKVAANKDTKRKGFDKDALALNIFFENNPDAKKDTRVFMHTLPRFPGGFNIDHWYDICGVAQYVKVIDEFFWWQGLTPEDMAKLYGGFDVLLNASRGEGFGIPIIEAAACGVPTIGTNFTAMPELIRGHGWLVEKYNRELTAALSFIASPSEYEMAQHLEDAYNNRDKTAQFGEASRKFALNYDWRKVIVPLWVNLIEEIREEMRPRTLAERRMMT